MSRQDANFGLGPIVSSLCNNVLLKLPKVGTRRLTLIARVFDSRRPEMSLRCSLRRKTSLDALSDCIKIRITM